MDSISRYAKQRENFDLIQSALHKAAPRLAAFKHQLYGKPEEEVTKDALESVINALYMLKDERAELDLREAKAKAAAKKHSKLKVMLQNTHRVFSHSLSLRLLSSLVRSIRQ